MGAHLQLVRH